MVKAAGLARVEELVFSAVVLDLDPAFLDIDIWGAVFAHGAELDDMTVWLVAQNHPNQIEGDAEIVAQGQLRLVKPPHRIRRRGLLRVMHDDVGQKTGKKRIQEHHVGAVADRGFDSTTLSGAENVCARLQVGSLDQRLGTGAARNHSPQIIVYHDHIVPGRREMHGRGPAQVAVAAENHHAHRTPLVRSGQSSRRDLAARQACLTDVAGRAAGRVGASSRRLLDAGTSIDREALVNRRSIGLYNNQRTAR